MAATVGSVLSKGVKCLLDISSKCSPKVFYNSASAFHISTRRNGLEEFFDIPENYAKVEVKVGRPWEKDDLRIKSNSDLHKLWYVLLKEKNMLLTMQHAYRYSKFALPSPERIEKVQESMKNLEDVVRERNRAYFELETGTHGERPNRKVLNIFGLYENVHLEEFLEPTEREEVQEERIFPPDSPVLQFRRLLREKLKMKENKAKRSDNLYVKKLIKLYPDLDLDYLQEMFPHLNVRKLTKNRRSYGHYDRREASWAKPRAG